MFSSTWPARTHTHIHTHTQAGTLRRTNLFDQLMRNSLPVVIRVSARRFSPLLCIAFQLKCRSTFRLLLPLTASLTRSTAHVLMWTKWNRYIIRFDCDEIWWLKWNSPLGKCTVNVLFRLRLPHSPRCSSRAPSIIVRISQLESMTPLRRLPICSLSIIPFVPIWLARLRSNVLCTNYRLRRPWIANFYLHQSHHSRRKSGEQTHKIFDGCCERFNIFFFLLIKWNTSGSTSEWHKRRFHPLHLWATNLTFEQRQHISLVDENWTAIAFICRCERHIKTRK